MKTVPNNLVIQRNESVLKYLKPLSCHGDIIEPLVKELKKYPLSKSFCPDGSQFKYCLWFLNDTVFAYGSGMCSIGLRLPTCNVEGVEKSEAGTQWYSIPYDSPYIAELVENAYQYALVG